ncbi:MAG TPA: CHASE domain-containing protein, partial [Burkholderiaceae bacterium]|nr:CHASE domain-containing protein [Burkholderiaceae bacterium]
MRIALSFFLMGLLISAAASWRVYVDNQKTLRYRFDALTADISDLITDRFSLYEHGLRAMRGMVRAVGDERITRNHIAVYTQTLNVMEKFPGTRGFGLIRRVPRGTEAAFLARARADGASDFDIKELHPHEGDHFVIQYIYPIEKNPIATGLDIASESNRRAAALASARDDQPRLTAPITLVQSSGLTKHGFLILLPVYDDAAPISTPAEREAAAVAWAYSPLVIDELLVDLAPRLEEVGFAVSDAAETDAFYQSPKFSTADNSREAINGVRELNVLGRTWRLHVHALPAFAANAHLVSPWIVFIALSVLFGACACAIYPAMRLRKRRLEARDEQERMARGIVEAMPQALVVVNENGRIVHTNQNAVELFKYSREQLLGRAVTDLIPIAHRDGHAQLRAVCRD